MGEPIGIHACEAVCALGDGLSQILARAQQGWTDGMQMHAGYLADQETTLGAVPQALPGLAGQDASRNNALLWYTYLKIAAQVEQAITRFGAARVGIVLGSSTTGISDAEAAYCTRAESGSYPASYDYAIQEIGSPARFLQQQTGIQGPAYVISTACTSGAKAFASARDLLLADVCDAVVVGGVDTLCRFTVRGFHALKAIDTQRCNPCSVNRAGINIGEAAALFIVTREASAVQLYGCGASSDAHHVSAPHPEGLGAQAAMVSALQDAGLDAGDLGYVNLHGTATRLNDSMESLAVDAVYGSTVPVSSTKAMTGHTLGAAGALEAAIVVALLQQGLGADLPLHVWDGQPDPDLAQIRLVQPSDRLEGRYAASNSFAFGGSNISLVFGAS